MSMLVVAGLLSALGVSEPHCSAENVVHWETTETTYQATYLRNECNYVKSFKVDSEAGTILVVLEDDENQISSEILHSNKTEEVKVTAFNDDGWPAKFIVKDKMVYSTNGEMITDTNWYNYVMDEYNYSLDIDAYHEEAIKEAHQVGLD